jgi:hypothetical protein
VNDDPVVLHSSWHGLLSAFVAPLLLVGAAVLAVVANGWRPVPIVFLAAGALLLVSSLFDYPRRTLVSARGVERHCAVRVQRFSWDDVRCVVRAPGSRLRRSYGGLALRRGRHRYLLVDQAESVREFEALRDAMAEWAPDVAFDVWPPSRNTPPTWLYRRGGASRAQHGVMRARHHSLPN